LLEVESRKEQVNLFMHWKKLQ